MTSSNNFLFYHEAVKCKVSNVSRKGQQFRSVRTVVTVQVVNISFGLLTSASLSSWNSICGTSLRDVARNGPHGTRRGTAGLECQVAPSSQPCRHSRPQGPLLLVTKSDQEHQELRFLVLTERSAASSPVKTFYAGPLRSHARITRELCARERPGCRLDTQMCCKTAPLTRVIDRSDIRYD